MKTFFRIVLLASLFIPFGGAALEAGIRGSYSWAALWLSCLACQVLFLAKLYKRLRAPIYQTEPYPEWKSDNKVLQLQQVAKRGGNSAQRRKARRALLQRIGEVADRTSSQSLDRSGVGESTGSLTSGPVVRGGAR